MKDGKPVPVMATIEVNFRPAVIPLPESLLQPRPEGAGGAANRFSAPELTEVYAEWEACPSTAPAAPQPANHIWLIAAAVVLLLVFGRSLCSWVIDYFWWGEMGQVPPGCG
jgi:hypothetical protein